ncbi:MAG: TolC family protein [Candidatus Korobacteraceae bacterium]|jgi:outer membrane protein TolC
MMKGWRLKKFLWGVVTAVGLSALAAPCAAEPIPFHRVIELALQRGGVLAISAANQQKAREVYQQARAAYFPTIVFGSGLGYTYGIPPTLAGSAPSIFSISSQQALLNFAQQDLVRAAKNEWKSAGLDVADKRSAVILDAAATYMELDNAMRQLKVLTESAQTANRAEFITRQRLKEGLDSQLDLKKSQLNVARVNMRIADVQSAADVARQHLSALTGLPQESIETASDSIPSTPAIQQEENLAAQAAQNNPAVRLAEQKVVTAQWRARAENRALYPSIDFATQYQRLSNTINNYQQYFRAFTPNSLAVGISIRFPISDFAQHARANAAMAELLRVRKEAALLRSQVEENTLKTQRSLRRLAAATDVARLEYEVAQAGIESVSARLATGEANVRDRENAQLDASNRYSSYLDSQLALSRAGLELMRQTGELDAWALPAKP